MKRASWKCLFCICLVAVVSACNSTDASGSVAPANSTGREVITASYRPEDQPVFRLLYQRLGISSERLRELGDRARVASFVTCMDDRGFPVPNEAAVPLVRLPGGSYSPVDEAMASIRADASLGGASLPEDATIACLDESEAVNPFNDLFALVQSATKDVSDRVTADPRYVQAREDMASCPQEESPTDGRQVLIDRVSAIASSYKSGALAAAEALQGLARLEAEAASIDWTVNGNCDVKMMAIERRLVTEYQEKYLSDHPGFVDGVAEQFKPVVDRFLGL